jgi:hypothetical protein
MEQHCSSALVFTNSCCLARDECIMVSIYPTTCAKQHDLCKQERCRVPAFPADVDLSKFRRREAVRIMDAWHLQASGGNQQRATTSASIPPLQPIYPL